MLKNWVAAAAAAAFVACVAASLAAPLEAYGKLPTLTDVTISPDGATLAYVRPVEGKRVVVTQTLASRQILGMVDVTGAKLRDLQWADNHTLIITTSVTTIPPGFTGHRQEFFMAQTFNTETKAQYALFDHDPSTLNVGYYVLNVIAGVPQPRIIGGHTVVFVPGIYFPKDTGYVGLFRIDLTTNSTSLISKPRDPHVEGWAISTAGNIVAEESYYEDEKHWKLDILQNGEMVRALDVSAPIESPTIEGLNDDGTALIVSLSETDSGPVYQQVLFKDHTLQPWTHDGVFDGLITSLRTGHVVGGTHITGRSDYVFFDPQADKMWRHIKDVFKGATDVNLASWSDDRSKAVAHVFGPRYGEGYYFVDAAQPQITPIGWTYADIGDVAAEHWIEYTAADGRVLQGYLTLPPGKAPKNLPLIVLPHGGPHSRDDPGFDWISQALASRGYVVLQPQFRGSAGFGGDLLNAGFGEFGKKMQTDLSDSVRALAAQGVIDPKRVCIVGASYGGYAALAGATLDTGIYRCAVSIAGLSDLRAQLRYWRELGGGPDRNDRFWDRFLGVEEYSDPKLDAISPIKHVDKVTIPILLIHGKDDTVVPYAQSDDMADALKDAKKPYEFVTLKHEDHWLSNSETRLQMLEATVKFVETNNPPN